MNLSNSIFLDTNILLYLSFEDLDKQKHLFVNRILEKLINENWNIYISSQIVREFFAISTNSKIFQRPLSAIEAIDKIKEFKGFFYMLFDTNDSLDILQQLVIDYKIERQKIHDTNIVATMISYKIEHLFTFNTKDFLPFKEIKLLPIES